MPERTSAWFKEWGNEPVGYLCMGGADDGKEFEVYCRADGAHLIVDYAFGADAIFLLTEASPAVVEENDDT